MGWLTRLKSRQGSAAPTDHGGPVATRVPAVLLGGDDDLEVVGESFYQDALWALSGASPGGDRTRVEIIAVLVPEPTNPHDSNAIGIHIEGRLVGYLARQTAQEYFPGLRRVMAERGRYIALNGVIVGGGYYDDGPGRLGVWLEHDPVDFGVRQTRTARGVPAGQSAVEGAMRTGFSEAWLTDLDDDSYDLSWFDELPDADRPAIAKLRGLLAEDPDPIDRHFQFAELEARLYRSRDLFETALAEYDEVCARHDAEMDTIRQAFMIKWGKVPLLETYRQMAIRQQKKKDRQTCLWWAERGLALYGETAAREDAVEDLLKRRNRAITKLQAAVMPAQSATVPVELDLNLASRSQPIPKQTDRLSAAEIEVLLCRQCQGSFERARVRGRKPTLCPVCRSAAPR